MEWEKFISAEYIYVDLTDDELNNLTQNHYFTKIDDIAAIGVSEPIEEFKDRLYEQPVKVVEPTPSNTDSI